jgi:hypothetical protein
MPGRRHSLQPAVDEWGDSGERGTQESEGDSGERGRRAVLIFHSLFVLLLLLIYFQDADVYSFP